MTAAIKVERCSPGADHPYRPFPVHRNPCGCTTPPPRRSRRRRRGRPPTIYVCGITPYDATHLGHAATYLAFDLVQRVWLDNGHRVHSVQNITDIDDPLLERAHRDPIDWRDLAAREIQLFREDMTALRVLPPRRLHRRGRGDGRGVGRSTPTAGLGRRLPGGRPAVPGRLLRYRGRPEVRLRIPVRPGHHAEAVRRAGRRPGPRGQAEPARPAALADAERRASRHGRHRSVRDGPAGTSNAR